MYGIRNSEQRTHYPRKQLRLHQAQPIRDLHKSFHLPIYNIRNRTKSQVQCEFFLPFFPGSFLLTDFFFPSLLSADDYIPDITPYTLFFPFPIQSHNLHHIVFETAFFLFPSLPSSPSHRCKNYSCFYIRCLSPL